MHEIGLVAPTPGTVYTHFNPWCAEVMLGNMTIYLHFFVISQHWDDTTS